MRMARHRHPLREGEHRPVFGPEDRDAWTVLLACTLGPAVALLLAALVF
ncbi:MAG TPA: hypothetical protein VEA40_06035 [Ramlibacter sp.]|nr:hypothetical protein [Ramlibacter sp.]